MKPKSHTLFHFTRSRATLESILMSGFWPRYCLEDVAWLGISDRDYVAYPMVCFCDIPLSRTDEHVAFYGEFGIGMSKEWAVRNQLNPVLYLAGQNSLVRTIINLGEFPDELTGEQQGRVFELLRHLTAHIKPSEGTMVIGNDAVTKEFYQESEWRYVPRDEHIRDYLGRNEFDQPLIRDDQNSLTRAHGILSFTPNDVRYIFVPSDSDIPALINFIQKDMDSYPSADLKVLMSRVTSLEAIRRDL